MADNKDMQDGRDRTRIAANEDYELQHVAEKMNVSVQAVREAIAEVGNNRDDVEDYLLSRRNR